MSDVTCCKCGYYRGEINASGYKFICSHCKSGEDMSIERAEQRFGA